MNTAQTELRKARTSASAAPAKPYQKTPAFMSIASQFIDREKNGRRPAPNSSTRPRLYGFLSTPEPFDLTEWQDRAHKANRLTLTHRKGSGLGFGGIGCRLSGMPSRPRKARRRLLRVRNWMRRDAARRQDPTAAAPTAPRAPKPRTFAGKVSRMFGRMFGRKGGRK